MDCALIDRRTARGFGIRKNSEFLLWVPSLRPHNLGGPGILGLSYTASNEIRAFR